MNHTKPNIILSVDVECWGQSVLDRSLPILPHAADNVRRLMQLFELHNAKATLFVLGKFAEVHPDVVAQAADAGHEIASHGYGHVEVFRMSPSEFRDDIRKASDIIAGIVGRRPKGYRAPVFSIRRDSIWALDVLADEGFEFDSSIFPFAGPRYGIADWPAGPCTVKTKSGHSIVEYPPTTLQLFGRRLPVGGGGYARLLPKRVLRMCFDRATRDRSTPPVFYCHPYEIDKTEIDTHYPGTPLKRRLHQGIGRKSFWSKLDALLARFSGTTFGSAIAKATALPRITPGEPENCETPKPRPACATDIAYAADV
ncbi:MAG: polysaccharide deacetylase family protein [Phycisphaerales bacterium]|nr:polysaccharide deacetylase family protein [Phycisphaerales bacterium]